MNNHYLIECGLEEMPANVIDNSLEQLETATTTFLKEHYLPYESIETFATPRRLAIRINGLGDKQPDREEVFKGPSLKVGKANDGTWSKAAVGFAKSKGATANDLFIDDFQGEPYLFVKQKSIGLPTSVVVAHIAKLFERINFPVTMHWQDHSFSYVRPVHWVVSLLNDDIIPTSIFNITADRISRGHRFLGSDVKVRSALTYEEDLEKAHVIVSPLKRQEMIVSQIKQIEAEKNVLVELHPDLLKEVRNIVEYPTVFMGNFSKKYLELPECVLITTMKDHQRYFEVYDAKSKELQPHFISVRNGNHNFIDNVIKGNEKVLVARLEDALFFYHDDLKRSIEDYVSQLSQLSVHEKIGSMAEKQRRVSQIVNLLAKDLEVDSKTSEAAITASKIFKFDLMTQTVQELTELQGTYGEVFALKKGVDPVVAKAIGEQYLPVSSHGRLPESVAGSLLALADKIDNIISFFSAGLLPTGSNDPFALRRQAMGIVQIILANKWIIDLDLFVKELSAIYGSEQANVTDSILDFINERFSQYASEKNIPLDIIKGVQRNRHINYVRRLQIANYFFEHPELKSEEKDIIEGLVRVIRIIKSNTVHPVNPSQFLTESEKALFEAEKSVPTDYEELPVADQIAILEKMVPLINNFFDENMVMVDDQPIRENRIALLEFLKELILDVIDVTELKTK